MAARDVVVKRLRRRGLRDALLADVVRVAEQVDVAVWLVGGAVRDAARGVEAEDLDLAAGRGAARLVAELEALWQRRLFRFRKRGVTTWRTRVHEREVDIVDAGGRGIERDLARRDFTINALAFDLREHTLLDPHDGLRDLSRKRLRVPRASVLREDPLRALRAARFLAALPGFRLEPATRAGVKRCGKALARVSRERIFGELDRLLRAEDPVRGLQALDDLKLLRAILPELVPMKTCVAGAARPSVWKHTLLAIGLAVKPGRLPGAAAVREAEQARVLRFALLLHDIAKPATLDRAGDGRPTFHGHEVLGERKAGRLLKRLKAPIDLERRVAQLVLFHLRPHHLADAGAPPRGIRRLVREAGDDLPLLVLHAACDAKASGSPAGEAAARWRRLRPVLVQLLDWHERMQRAPLQPLVSGKDVMELLGIPPGPAVGAVLRMIQELQEDGGLRDREAALSYLRAGAQA